MTKTNVYDITKNFTLRDYNTSISKEEYEANFMRTKESVRFTFNGWDGKSYEGQSRTARVVRCNIPGFEEFRFIKVGKGLHYIDEYHMVTENATGKQHPGTSWIIDVRRA